MQPIASAYRRTGREWRQRLQNLLGGTPSLRSAQREGHGLESPGVVGLHQRDPLQEWRNNRLLGVQGAGASASQPDRGHHISGGHHFSQRSATAAELRSRLQELLQVDCGGPSDSGEQMSTFRPMTVDSTPIQTDEMDVTAKAPGMQQQCQPSQAPHCHASDSLLDDHETVDAAAMGETCISGMMHCQTRDPADLAGEDCGQCVHRISTNSTSNDDIRSGSHEPPEVSCASPGVPAPESAGSASQDCAARVRAACFGACTAV